VGSGAVQRPSHGGECLTIVKSTLPRLPEALLAALQISPHPTDANAVYSLITSPGVDDGWSSVAQLGPAEVRALTDELVALVLWPGSGSAANLTANGAGQLLLQLDQAFVTIRLQVLLRHDDRIRRASGFIARVVAVLWDEVDYARIASGPTFVLTDPDTTAARWRANEETINEMRSKL
jgi:hypothetical protein